MLILIHLGNTNRGLKNLLMNIFLFLQLPQEDHQLGNWNASKKHHLEEESLKEPQLTKDYVKDLYKKLSENIDETPELFHYDYFKLEGGELYYIGNRKHLTTEGKLKSVGMLVDILGKNRLRKLGFNIPVGKVTAWQAVMLNKAAEELPSESDITGADDIELQEIAEKASDIISQIKDIQTDTEDLFKHPLCELFGLDKQLRTIQGSLKVEVAKKLELEECIAKERHKLKEF